MPEIHDVKVTDINDIGIPPVRSIFTGLPVSLPNSPPVTVTIGSPIVDIPGCVEFNPNGPGAVDSDPAGNRVLCDGEVPSFNPIQYEPNKMILSGPPEVPPYKEEENTPEETSDAPIIPTPKSAEVPAVTVKEEKKEEEVIEIEKPTFVEQYLPSAEEVTTTVTIALAAATAAVFGKPLAELLLKSIKPLVKNVVQKVKNKFGVKKAVLSVAERRQIQRDLRK